MANERVSLIKQEGFLKSSFPGSIIKRDKEKSLIWIHNLLPSPISNTYKVKLQYEKGEGVSFYIMEPKLKLAEGQTLLPHVYSTDEQKLCLFYPKYREWTSSMIFTKTIIPWACEWMQHYEIWVVTGEWHGGGIHVSADDVELEKEEFQKANVQNTQ